MKPVFNRLLMASAVLLAALLLANVALLLRNTDQLRITTGRVGQTREAIAGLEKLLSLMKDAESGQWGYVITGEPSYLKPYNAALDSIHQEVDHVERVTIQDPPQNTRLSKVRELIVTRLDILNQVMGLRQNDGFEAARQLVATGAGKQQMDAIRDAIGDMIAHERKQLAHRTTKADSTFGRAIVTGLVASLAALAALVAFMIVLRRHLAARAAAAHVILEQGERLRTTLASIGDAVITTDTEGRITNLNAVAEALTGWTNDDALGQPLDAVFRIVNETTRETTESPVTKALRDGKAVGLANHTVLIAKDGTERAISDSAAPIRCRDGEVVGCVMVFRDVTARRREEQALQRSEQEHRDFFDNATIGLHWVGPDGVILRANKTELDMLGYEREEYVGRNISEFHADAHVIDDILQLLSKAKALHEYPARLQCKDGSIKNVLINSNVLWEGDKFIHTRCFTLDVTERLKAENALRTSEARKSAILTSALDCIISMDHEGFIVDFNPAAERTFGHRREEVLGRTVAETIIPPEFREAHARGLARFMSTGEGPVLGRRVELSALRADGSQFPCELAITTTRLEGAPPFFTAYLRDITVRIQAEAAVRESERRFREMIDALPAAIYTTDAEGRLTHFNPAAVEFSGRVPELGSDQWCVSWKLYHADGTPMAHDECPMAISLKEGRPVRGIEAIAERPNGTRVWFMPFPTPLRDADGKLVGGINMLMDITERKRTEGELRGYAEELARADRSKDEFLAMLAHELRNPLAPLSNAAKILEVADASADERGQAQRILGRQLENMSRMIDDLLDVSRITAGKIELRRKPVALGAILSAAASLARSSLAARRQELAVSMPAESVYLNADATRLEQVFSNLLGNACKYSGEGCHISLSAERDDGEVVVRVRDDGIGIAPEVLPMVFDLFVQSSRTLDRAHGGLGIGLTVVERLVKLHGGSVEARSEGLGHGSEFIVRLPILLEAPPPDEPTPVTLDETPHRILIVDDNADSARSMAILQSRARPSR